MYGTGSHHVKQKNSEGKGQIQAKTREETLSIDDKTLASDYKSEIWPRLGKMKRQARSASV